MAIGSIRVFVLSLCLTASIGILALSNAVIARADSTCQWLEAVIDATVCRTTVCVQTPTATAWLVCPVSSSIVTNAWTTLRF